MKLYLSSYYFAGDGKGFGDLIGDCKNVAIILNANDAQDGERRPFYLNREIERMNLLGLDADELDLRDYFGTNEIQNRLNSYGAVWVMGGNSFTLRRAMRQSRFDIDGVAAVWANKLVYGGFSAGSVVAAPTLNGIDIVDPNDEEPLLYAQDIIWEGLNLVDYSIAPHYKSEHPESELVDEVVSYFQEKRMAYRTLRDGEAIIVQ